MQDLMTGPNGAPHPGDNVAQVSTFDQIGPREPGTVYDNASGMFRVLAVVTEPAEARRILRRNAAKFAVLVQDMHTTATHYTGAVWTGSDRVLKAVA